eukprot:TRINITY_DN13116_c0_g2_i1.p1 TRINITY_DN13116_c0_g2~~TRINITY_DN13116_c0_g2_i1.p1  ORF type:complete len:182 (+),score=2.75 TRINITY_DN13116_c0_g2_i1:385-930(+)
MEPYARSCVVPAFGCTLRTIYLNLLIHPYRLLLLFPSHLPLPLHEHHYFYLRTSHQADHPWYKSKSFLDSFHREWSASARRLVRRRWHVCGGSPWLHLSQVWSKASEQVVTSSGRSSLQAAAVVIQARSLIHDALSPARANMPVGCTMLWLPCLICSMVAICCRQADSPSNQRLHSRVCYS